MKKCIILEMENSKYFEKAMNDYIDDGYKVESSSCNSRYYKAILVLKEDEENFSSCIRINIVFWNDWMCVIGQSGNRYKE